MSDKKKATIEAVVSILFIGIFCLIYLYWYFGSLDLNLNKPLLQYGDALGVYATAKQITETGWFYHTDLLGAPYIQDSLSATSGILLDANNIFIWLYCLLLGGNWIKAVNYYYFSLFFINAISAYYVLRKLKIQNVIAVFSGLAFGFSFFIFARHIGHLCLSAFFVVPLAILVCIWIFFDEDFLRFKGFFEKKENLVAVFIAFLLAISFAYFPYFACFFFAVAAFSGFVKGNGLYSVISAFKMIFLTGFFFGLNKISFIIQILSGETTGEEIARSPIGVEYYGLKIFKMLLPPNGFYSARLQSVQEIYKAGAPVSGEAMEYIGVMAAMGFIFLLVCLFVRKKESETFRTLGLLSELNIAAVLLGSVGGFSMVIAFFVTDYIRCYNRICIFITFIGILAIAIVLNSFYDNIAKNEWQRIAVLGYGAVVALLTVYTNSAYIDFPAAEPIWDEEEDWIKTIDDQLPDGAMVYQLPFVKYPENGPVNDMGDYELYDGYLHSDNIRWSYGAYTGTEAYEINEAISHMDVQDMVDNLVMCEYDGIYIDARAYEEDELKELTDGITGVLGEKPDVYGTRYFYNLADYAAAHPGMRDGIVYTTEDVEYFPMTTDTVIYMGDGDENNGDRYLQEGFFKSEEGSEYSWTDGTEFDLKYRFKDCDPGDVVYVTMDVPAVFTGSQILQVETGGKKVYDDTVHKNQTVTFPVYLDDEACADIHIMLPQAISPMELGTSSSDSRQVALGVRKIEFKKDK